MNRGLPGVSGSSGTFLSVRIKQRRSSSHQRPDHCRRDGRPLRPRLSSPSGSTQTPDDKDCPRQSEGGWLCGKQKAWKHFFKWLRRRVVSAWSLGRRTRGSFANGVSRERPAFLLFGSRCQAPSSERARAERDATGTLGRLRAADAVTFVMSRNVPS